VTGVGSKGGKKLVADSYLQEESSVDNNKKGKNLNVCQGQNPFQALRRDLSRAGVGNMHEDSTGVSMNVPRKNFQKGRGK